MDKLYRNLQILGKVPKYGRITRSHNGVIALEGTCFYMGAKRFFYAEGRHQTLHDLTTIVSDADDKVSAILDSRYFQTQCSEGDALWSDLSTLQSLAVNASMGIQNLQATYAADLTLEAELEVVRTKLHKIISKMETSSK